MPSAPGRPTTASHRAGAAALLMALLAAAALPSVPAPAAAADRVIRSFDDTRITFHWFPARGLEPGERAATVLQGPGFGGKGKTDPNGPDEGVIPGVGPLRRAGYNVLTWNPRGISPSGGRAALNAPSFEGRDTSALISWVARRPEALLDGPGDPRVGMTGGSYGGGIQFTTAAIDRRVDAIVPVIAWHSLMTSLYKARTIKTAWVTALVTQASLPGNAFDPAILKGAAQAQVRRSFTPDLVAFGRAAGPAHLVAEVEAPTLIIQGTVDNLFPLQEAVDNYHALRRHGTPVQMIWYCGGHGLCLSGDGDTSLALRRTYGWLARYLKGDRSASTEPGFTWVDQRGRYRTASRYPAERSDPITARGKGRLALVAAGGSGPLRGPLPGVSPVVAHFLRPTVPTRARNAVEVGLAAERRALVAGAPRLTLTYRGTSPQRDARVLAQIIDEDTGHVLGNQITPIRLNLDGRRHRTQRRLEPVGLSLRPGQRLTVQLVAQSTAYNTFPAGGSVRFSEVKVTLPTVAGARPLARRPLER